MTENVTSKKLLPCPFCGRDAKLTERPATQGEGDGFIAIVSCFCGGYSARAHQLVRADDAADAREFVTLRWNTRHAHEPPAAPVAYRKLVDSPYELRPRYLYRDDAVDGWEPLYARALQPPPKTRKCAANKHADPPQDCDAPFCGCNPAWSDCIQMLQECDLLVDRTKPRTAQPPADPLAVSHLRGLVYHWNEFGPAMCLEEKMHYAHEWLKRHDESTSVTKEPARELTLSESASFDKTLARSPRRIPDETSVADTPYCRKCGGPHWVGQCAL